jgi:hypothetical protein
MSSATSTVLKTLAKQIAARLEERAFCVVLRMTWSVAGPVKGSKEPNGRKKFTLSPDLRVGLP